jgi:hypothetical protein
MQSGAFLHFVVTLTALVARIAHLSLAVRSVLSALHIECANIFAELYVRSKWPLLQIECQNNILSSCPAYRDLTQFGTPAAAAATRTRGGGHKSLRPPAEI